MSHATGYDPDAADALGATVHDACEGHPNLVILAALLGVLAEVLIAAPPEIRAWLRQSAVTVIDKACSGELRHDH
jgi:hypothetical protein